MEICDFGLYALKRSRSVEDVRKLLNTTNVTHEEGWYHELFADKSADSTIVEAGEQGNIIMDGDRKFTILTRFTNTLLPTDFRNILDEPGGSIYVNTYDHIINNYETYSIDKAFETLAINKANTDFSLVFDPEMNEIYIHISSGYNKIWKISMSQRTVETYKNFTNPYKTNIGEEGLLISKLTEHEFVETDQELKEAQRQALHGDKKDEPKNSEAARAGTDNSEAKINSDLPETKQEPEQKSQQEGTYITVIPVESTQEALDVFGENDASKPDFTGIYIASGVGLLLIAAVVAFVMYMRYRKSIMPRDIETAGETADNGDSGE